MLSIEGLSRLHGSQYALNNVDLEVRAGEVIGLIDREGTGLLELTALLSGATSPDNGLVWLHGKRLQWPFRPQRHGIGILYREPQIVDTLDLASNIFLGNEYRQDQPYWRALLPYAARRSYLDASDLIARLNLNLPSPHTSASYLSNEQRQLVAIAQLVVQQPDLIIVDNPDRTLSLPYQEQLLYLIRGWQQDKRAVIFGSANLDYLFAVCDRIVILREGRVVIDCAADETNREETVAALAGSGDGSQQITPVIWALDSYYQALRQAELLRHNKQLLEQDLVRQDTINRQLLEQLSIQVEALDQANLALQNAQRRLLIEREQERKHLARELHDQMIQDLLSLNYQLEEAIDDSPEGSSWRDKLANVRRDVRNVVNDLRQICGKLRPPTIDSFGLSAAIKSYADTWSERTGIEVILDIDEGFGRLPEDTELSLFRIVQESLSNVRKHSQASQVRVQLHHASPRMLHLSVVDDGVGLDKRFDLARLSGSGHYGLLGITERVALLGGRITFRSQSEGGLLIQAEIPHPRIESTESTH
ncbi:MAG: ATP-binding cassette domain-containing protein [Anaerolineae bacterium]|nr:ATP-binding cassette domain-containing protein [Anaerolineae bacterium]